MQPINALTCAKCSEDIPTTEVAVALDGGYAHERCADKSRFCEAAREWDHDWSDEGVCQECGMGAA